MWNARRWVNVLLIWFPNCRIERIGGYDRCGAGSCASIKDHIMKIVTVLGARPEFIQAAPVSRALASCHEEIIVHTGQHYDDNMSAIFFRTLDLRSPGHHLGIGSGPHGRQTGRMSEAIESVLMQERPDAVLVYGRSEFDARWVRSPHRRR